MTEKYRFYLEIDKILQETDKPSVQLNELFRASASERFWDPQPFTMLEALKETDQNRQHHPEGTVWNHTLLVVDQAAGVKHESGNARAFMWAALLHDIGKPPTTKVGSGRITAYNHDVAGGSMAEEFLRFFNEEQSFIDRVTLLVRWHMQPLFIAKEMQFGRPRKMIRAFAEAGVPLSEIRLLSCCDRMGRHGAKAEEVRQFMALFDKKMSSKQ